MQLDGDSDKDGLGDGAEYDAWTAKSYSWSTDHDGDTLNGLRDVDSDNDGLNDRDELVDAKTKPHVQDTDSDGLTDFEEVVAYGGQYNPNDADTDNDGQSDGVEVALADTNGDFDKDGLKNGDEATYGTDPTKEDTDCDGAKDGPEYQYWGAPGNLLISDVDGDTLKDGIEIGTVGTPSQALYKTRPDVADTDGDGLRDDEEARNNVKVTCGNAQTQSAPLGASPLPTSVPMSSVPSLLAGLTQTAQGYYVGRDSGGWYVQGGYGVRLYVNATLTLTATIQQVVDALGVQRQSSGGSGAPGSNGQCTDPTFRDTDGDGLSDFSEQYGLDNPYKAQKYDANGPGGNTNACNPQSDGDGIPDGLELKANGWLMNPNNVDTDQDGRADNLEDSNGNGFSDLSYNSHTGASSQNNAGSAPIETSPADADTDDDGVSDAVELASGSRSNVLEWDTDRDGLSDGLERGETDAVKDLSGSYINGQGIPHTLQGKNVLGLADWPTYQKFHGPLAGGVAVTTTLVDVKDGDGDGIADGLEDLNHNGIFGDASESRPNAGDTDGDGLTDGRELLVYGTYTFQSFVQTRGDPAAAMAYDGALFKTNPLLASTDESLPGGDLVPDGKDINPKGNGLMLLQLGMFWQYDEIDAFDTHGGNDKHETDLKLKIKLKTGVGDFAVNTAELTDFGRQRGVTFAGHGMNLVDNSKQNPPSVTGATLDFIRFAAGTDDTVQFDLPDNIDDFVMARDLKVRVQLDAIDADWGSADDTVDVSEKKGEAQYPHVDGIDMTAGPLGGGQIITLDANGNGDVGNSVARDNNDGRLKVNFSNNLVPYFLRNILGTQVLSAASWPSSSWRQLPLRRPRPRRRRRRPHRRQATIANRIGASPSTWRPRSGP
jgi:hypothetical protein